MAKLVTPLSDARIRALKAAAKPYDTADGSGLFIRTLPSGAKRWVFRYKRPILKTVNNWVIGEYPSMTLADARDRRTEYRSQLANGIDPREHETKTLPALQTTFADLGDMWLAHKQPTLSRHFYRDTVSALNNHVYPVIGALPVGTIKTHHGIAVLDKLVADGKPEQARRMASRMRSILDFGLNRGLLKANPFSVIGRNYAHSAKESHPSIDPDRLPHLLDCIQHAQIGQTTRNLILTQLHLMLRPGECAQLRWDWFDDDSVTLPADIMKRRIPHQVPLTSQVKEVLDMQRGLSDIFVFPAQRDTGKHASKEAANTALKRMGFQGILVAHGMRALAYTALVEVGDFDEAVADRCLAHSPKSLEVTASSKAYHRGTKYEARRLAHAWWSTHIEKAFVEGVTSKARFDV